MQTHNRQTFTTIHTEGALLPVDLLQRIRANDAKLEGLDPESYHLAPGEKINEAINRSWNRLNGLWGAFQTARRRLGEGDLGTTLTRERWLLPLFQELGYGRLNTSKAVEMEGKSYPISHRWQTIPIHLVGCGLGVDKRTPGVAGASRTSPHSLVQEYLNRSDDAQWGLVSNGLSLRVLRDNAALTRQAYIDFDLESIFDGEVYSDFILLWLICHQSRFETTEKQTDCLLERWSKSAQESGTRALDDLRRGVEGAIVSLGQGFLQHTLNNELRTKLKNGDLPAQDYYRQLLRLVYRLIFLFAAEDRDLLLLPDTPVEAKKRYLDYYSTVKLRLLSDRQRGSRHYDRYEGIRLVFKLLSGEEATPLREGLALPALGGFLFDSRSTADLNEAKLDNQALLTALRSLAFITEGNTRRAVDYRNLGPEELGSVYESLLELHPLLNTDAGTFELSSAAGNERKTTGSYYTPSSLINVLLDSALDPVIQQALENASRQDATPVKLGQATAKEPSSKENLTALREKALLDLKVCDPACGSGHFLIAAAHRIAGRLAEVRAEDNEPSPIETRHALRDVIRHCIYGVDINPMAVELCKVNLWLESIEPGKPLSFLDAHIKCGNSLVGVGPKMDLNELEVPDEAFNPVTGDHKPTAALLKKRNKQEREGQESLFVTVIKTHEDLDQWLAERTRALEAMPEDNAVEVQAKAEAYHKVNESDEYRKQKQIADLWTAAFFWKIDEPISTNLEIVAPTHGQLHRLRNGSSTQSDLINMVEKISQVVGFFHWPLEFVDVATLGGFNCMLGNPPWERIKLQEEEFFATNDPEIAKAINKAARQKLINFLEHKNPDLAFRFKVAKHAAECSSKFARQSSRFPFSAIGDVNTYALFTELFRNALNSKGKAGIIVPTGIVTDDTMKCFFENLISTNSLESVVGFENEDFLFSGIANVIKFCNLTICAPSHNPLHVTFAFYLRRAEQIKQKERFFELDAKDLLLLNPNTLTCPVFRTKHDSEITKSIYHRIPILENENNSTNEWQVSFLRMFDMSNDSNLFSEYKKEDFLPLFEAKFFWHYDHRFASFDQKGVLPGKGGRGLPEMPIELHQDPNYATVPQFWVPEQEVKNRIPDNWGYKWFVAMRGITSAKLERTCVFSFIPLSGVGNSSPVLVSGINNTKLLACLLANLNSLVFDYVARQKIAGTNMNFFFVKQFPVIPPNGFTKNNIDFVVPRVLELIYTAFDMKPFAEDMGYFGEPFQWEEDRRAFLRAELDAYYAKLYGLTRDELRYILDPQEVYGPDFPGETFRVLKEKEIKLYGEYRTRRLVLEAWDRLEGVEVGNPEGYREQAVIVEPKQESGSITTESRPTNDKSKPAKPSVKTVVPEDQPTLGDMHLYKCDECGVLVMGFDRENHVREKHGGQSVEWKKSN